MCVSLNWTPQKFPASVKPRLPADLYHRQIAHRLSTVFYGLLRTYTENLQKVFRTPVYALTVN